jgi:hypothetical protein
MLLRKFGEDVFDNLSNQTPKVKLAAEFQDEAIALFPITLPDDQRSRSVASTPLICFPIVKTLSGT